MPGNRRLVFTSVKASAYLFVLRDCNLTMAVAGSWRFVTTACSHVGNILCMRTGANVIWIAARWIVARVQIICGWIEIWITQRSRNTVAA
jgi:hypothetical protein